MKQIQAVQQFSVDEIAESSAGPVVALKLTVFSSKGGAQPESIDIDIGLRLDQAEALGNALVELSEKMRSRLQ